MLFRASVSDTIEPVQSTFVNLNGDGAVQTVKFKPNDNLKFSVRMPNGDLYETLKDFNDPNSTHYRVVIDEFISDCTSHDYICKKPNKLFRAGITIPMMFTQQPSYSDNEGDFMNYQGYIEDSYWNALNNGKR